MTACIFCKIISGEIKTDIIYQDDQVLSFADLTPQAPTHLLIIPKKHIATLNDVCTEDLALIAHMLFTAQNLARAQGIDESGYRTLFNCNKAGGQSVYHIHLHLLGGRQLNWPPG